VTHAQENAREPGRTDVLAVHGRSTSWISTLRAAADPSLIQLETLVRGHLDPAAVEAALADVLAADPRPRGGI